MRYSDRYYRNGEMENHCIALLCHMNRCGDYDTTIRELSKDCGIPRKSLEHILHDAYEDKTHSTLFLVAMKYGFDFMVHKTFNYAWEQYVKYPIISVVKCDWNSYKYPD